MFEHNKKQELTSRQKQILSLLRKGLTNIEICKTLGISANTVKVHLANIYKTLEVTNRTEAASSDIYTERRTDDIKKDLNIIFFRPDNISAYSKANGLYHSVVESLQQYRIFRIMETAENQVEPAFSIDISVAKDADEILYISIRLGSSHDIIWENTVQSNTDNLLLLARKTAMLLFRNLILATAKMEYTPKSPVPYWWYAVSLCDVRLESRGIESFEFCKHMLSPLATEKVYSEQAVYMLSRAHYIAIMENWGNAQTHTKLLGEFARKTMYNAPYSIYSKMIMGLYNIVTGHKKEGSSYLQQVIEENPQSITARTLLIQIYMVTNQTEKALELIEESEQIVPETAVQASIYHARAFILLMQGRYDECINLARQILIYNPRAMSARLFTIFCYNKQGKTADSETQIKALYEEHPNFGKPYIDQLLKGLNPQMKTFFMDSLKNVFPKDAKTHQTSTSL